MACAVFCWGKTWISYTPPIFHAAIFFTVVFIISSSVAYYHNWQRMKKKR
ncbi:hypothetical protein HMPREF1039_0160 [Megasphaera lornae]|uniref:Uncharacterized protein n=1 Tax=Megasphaera lornae TaxID=1000568 RepID=A0ABN0D4L4_9FIRM|nr:hypothetical protein HMPREF1039_0160 [Megasphaera lornae]